MLLAAPAWAQPRSETTLLDLELWMRNESQHLCLVIPRGEVSVTTSVTQSLLVPSQVKVSLVSLTGTMDGNFYEFPVTNEAITRQLPVAGGPYCWHVDASPNSFNDGLPRVAVKLIHIAP